jgi:glycosyltransferase involved in cell wall biosynthesis
MKIGIISNLYPPFARGGAENVIVRTVEALNEAGHDVFVISTHPRHLGATPVLDRTTTERIYRFFPSNIYHTLEDNKYRWFTRLWWHVIDTFSGSAAYRVRQILASEKPDVVITHNLKGIGLRIPRAIRSLHLPHVHVVHDLQLVYPSGLLLAGKEEIPWHTKPFFSVYRTICRFLFGNPSVVIFPSKYLRDVYQAHGFFEKSQVEIMPNPAPRFIPVVREQRNPGALKLLFVGQLETHKGIEFLISVFKKLSFDVSLIIAGEGTKRALIEGEMAKDKRIVYLGYISLEQLVNCLGVVDAVVVPSLCYENSPTVIYESLNAGVPVLAANIGGVGELITEGVSGYLFKPGSEEDAIRVITKLQEEKDRFSQAQEEIRATVAPHELHQYTGRLLAFAKTAIDKEKK